MSTSAVNKVFDYRALRLLVGIIALSIPFIVWILAKVDLTSISASYYTDARDAFVGMLFIVGAFLWAYNGHDKKQERSSKVAAVSAIGVALFPTTCATCESTIIGSLHYVFAAILFVILTIFCFVFFQKDIQGQSGEKGRRSKIYKICGSLMVIAIVTLGSQMFIDFKQMFGWTRVTFWAEALALCAFGVAWIVAGKYLPGLATEEERLKLFE